MSNPREGSPLSRPDRLAQGHRRVFSFGGYDIHLEPVGKGSRLVPEERLATSDTVSYVYDDRNGNNQLLRNVWLQTIYDEHRAQSVNSVRLREHMPEYSAYVLASDPAPGQEEPVWMLLDSRRDNSTCSQGNSSAGLLYFRSRLPKMANQTVFYDTHRNAQITAGPDYRIDPAIFRQQGRVHPLPQQVTYDVYAQPVRMRTELDYVEPGHFYPEEKFRPVSDHTRLYFPDWNTPTAGELPGQCQFEMAIDGFRLRFTTFDNGVKAGLGRRLAVEALNSVPGLDEAQYGQMFFPTLYNSVNKGFVREGIDVKYWREMYGQLNSAAPTKALKDLSDRNLPLTPIPSAYLAESLGVSHGSVHTVVMRLSGVTALYSSTGMEYFAQSDHSYLMGLWHFCTDRESEKPVAYGVAVTRLTAHTSAQ